MLNRTSKCITDQTVSFHHKLEPEYGGATWMRLQNAMLKTCLDTSSCKTLFDISDSKNTKPWFFIYTFFFFQTLTELTTLELNMPGSL